MSMFTFQTPPITMIDGAQIRIRSLSAPQWLPRSCPNQVESSSTQCACSAGCLTCLDAQGRAVMHRMFVDSAMRALAAKSHAEVIIGYNKNVAQYMREALAAMAAARAAGATSPPLVTLEHCNAFQPGKELVDFVSGAGAEGMLHNMGCHELALAAEAHVHARVRAVRARHEPARVRRRLAAREAAHVVKPAGLPTRTPCDAAASARVS